MLLKLHIKNNFLTGKTRTRCSQNNKTPCITRHATNLQTKRRLYGNVQPPFLYYTLITLYTLINKGYSSFRVAVSRNRSIESWHQAFFLSNRSD